MQRETEILQAISRITSAAPAFTTAVEQVSSLLRAQAGATVLLIETGASRGAPSIMRRPEVRTFLAGPEPEKRLYTLSLTDRSKEIGRMIIAFADPLLPAEATRKLANVTAEQFARLLGRKHPRFGFAA